MTYNSIAFTFSPLGTVFTPFPVVKQSTPNLTTAQLIAAGYSSVAVPAGPTPLPTEPTTAATLVEGAKARNTMTIYVPSDQQAVQVNNESTVGPLTGGFVVNPGGSLELKPYSDPLYAIGAPFASLVFFVDT